jgi:hypothetical protein
MSADELVELYMKLNLPEALAAVDFKRNKKLLNRCYAMGLRMGGDVNQSVSNSR